MITELISAIQVGMETKKLTEGLLNGEHYDDVDRAYDLYEAIDFEGDIESEIQEVLQCLESVNNDDRLFVKVAAWNLKAWCYAHIGQFTKARQNITRVLNAQTDTLTLNKAGIEEFKKQCKDLKLRIQNIEHPSSPVITRDTRDTKDRHEKRPSNSQRGSHQDRKQLLDIIAICDCRNGGFTEDTIIRTEPKKIRIALQKYGISISTSKIGSVNTYKGLINIIMDSNQHPTAIATTPVRDVAPLPDVATRESGIAKQHPQEETSFVFPIDHIIIKGDKGVVAEGSVALGIVHVGDDLFLANSNGMIHKTRCVGIKVSNSVCSQASAGERCSILLRSVLPSHFEEGSWLQKGERPIDINSILSSGNKSMSNAATPTPSCYTSKPIDYSTSTKSSQSQWNRVLSVDEQEYLELFKEYADDEEISDRDRKMLDKFRIRLGISEERAQELEASCSEPELSEDEQEYLEMYKEYASDGEITARDRKMLNKMRDRMGISEERAKEIESII